MDDLKFIRDEIRRSMRGPAWHGSSLLEVIADVSRKEAEARPCGDSHSILEIAAHILAWIEEVERRLRGGTPSEPERGDWPTGIAWSRIPALLEKASASLEQRLESFPAGHLDVLPWGDELDPPTGTGVSWRAMLHGLTQHTAYHAGQISLLKKALRTEGR